MLVMHCDGGVFHQFRYKVLGVQKLYQCVYAHQIFQELGKNNSSSEHNINLLFLVKCHYLCACQFFSDLTYKEDSHNIPKNIDKLLHLYVYDIPDNTKFSNYKSIYLIAYFLSYLDSLLYTTFVHSR